MAREGDPPKHCCDLKPHPDRLISASILLDSQKRYIVVDDSCHLIYAEASLYEGAGTDSTYVKLFTSNDPDDQEADTNLWTLPVTANLGSNSWTPDAVKGVAFSGGIFTHIESDDSTVKVILNVLAVRREHYTPAFPDSTEWSLNGWNCWREGELYTGFTERNNTPLDNFEHGDPATADGVLKPTPQ
jgi:hypothetical protein